LLRVCFDCEREREGERVIVIDHRLVLHFRGFWHTDFTRAKHHFASSSMWLCPYWFRIFKSYVDFDSLQYIENVSNVLGHSHQDFT
jgi:hypothetical protein